MEFFNKAKTVRLKSHLQKYLTADDDEETVRQSQEGSSRRARWTVEVVEGKGSGAIRLKSFHGKYLTASDKAFLLGMTGKKVLQTSPANKADQSVLWEPIKDGTMVKLRAKASGKFLRANGGTPPWKNSVTHDAPHRTATQDWILWEVDVVDITLLEEAETLPSPLSPVADYCLLPAKQHKEVASPRRGPRTEEVASRGPNLGLEEISSPRPGRGTEEVSSPRRGPPTEEVSSPRRGQGLEEVSSPRRGQGPEEVASPKSWFSMKSDGSFGRSSFNSLKNNIISAASSKHRSLSTASSGSRLECSIQSGMEFFNNAKAVRLQSHLGKYLVADDDESTVRQSRNGSSRRARWTVEFVEKKSHVIRLKSSHGHYLTATDEAFLLGMTGKKVLQTEKTDTSTEWEPIKEGFSVRLRSQDGKFLRANGGTPPWRNSVTHDVPSRTSTQDWVMWGVEVVDISLSDPSDDVALSRNVSSASNFSDDDFAGSPDFASPVPTRSKNGDNTFAGQSSDTFSYAAIKSEGRIIYYSVVDDDGNINDAREEPSFHFKGHSLEELTDKLEEETGLEDVIVCSRNPLNGQLYPLRLHLPPNNANMHIVVVPASSKVASQFAP